MESSGSSIEQDQTTVGGQELAVNASQNTLPEGGVVSNPDLAKDSDAAQRAGPGCAAFSSQVRACREQPDSVTPRPGELSGPAVIAGPPVIGNDGEARGHHDEINGVAGIWRGGLGETAPVGIDCPPAGDSLDVSPKTEEGDFKMGTADELLDARHRPVPGDLCSPATAVDDFFPGPHTDAQVRHDEVVGAVGHTGGGVGLFMQNRRSSRTPASLVSELWPVAEPGRDFEDELSLSDADVECGPKLRGTRIAPGNACTPNQPGKQLVHDRLYSRAAPLQQKRREAYEARERDELEHIEHVRSMVKHRPRVVPESEGQKIFDRMYNAAQEHALKMQRMAEETDKQQGDWFSPKKWRTAKEPAKAEGEDDGEDAGKPHWQKLYDRGQRKKEEIEQRVQDTIKDELDALKKKSVHRSGNTADAACSRLYTDSVRRGMQREQTKQQEDQRAQLVLKEESVHKNASSKAYWDDVGRRLYSHASEKEMRLRDRRREQDTVVDTHAGTKRSDASPDKARFDLLHSDARRRNEDLRIKQDLHAHKELEALKKLSVHSQANRRRRKPGEVQRIFERCFQAKSLASHRSIRTALHGDAPQRSPRTYSARPSPYDELSPLSSPARSPSPGSFDMTVPRSPRDKLNMTLAREMEDEWWVLHNSKTASPYTARAKLAANLTDFEIESLRALGQRSKSGDARRPLRFRRAGSSEQLLEVNTAGNLDSDMMPRRATQNMHSPGSGGFDACFSPKSASSRSEKMSPTEDVSLLPPGAQEEGTFSRNTSGSGRPGEVARIGDDGLEADSDKLLQWWRSIVHGSDCEEETLPQWVESPPAEPAESRFDSLHGSEGRRYTQLPGHSGQRIQAMHRGRLGRQIETSPGSYAHKIVCRLQAATRAMAARKRARAKALDDQKLKQAVQRIQRVWRGKLGRQRYAIRKQEKHEEELANMDYYERILYERRLHLAEDLEAMREKAARTIQEAYRARLKSLKEQRQKELENARASKWRSKAVAGILAGAKMEVLLNKMGEEVKHCTTCPACSLDFLTDCKFCRNCGTKRPEATVVKRLRPKLRNQIRNSAVEKYAPKVRRASFNTGQKALMSCEDLFDASVAGAALPPAGFESSKHGVIPRTRRAKAATRPVKATPASAAATPAAVGPAAPGGAVRQLGSKESSATADIAFGAHEVSENRKVTVRDVGLQTQVVEEVMWSGRISLDYQTGTELRSLKTNRLHALRLHRFRRKNGVR